MKSEAMDELLAVLRLNATPGIGSQSFQALISRYGNAQAALASRPAWPSPLQAAGPVPDREWALRELEAVDAYGARLLCRTGQDYPALLEHIADPPPVLTCRGEFWPLNAPAVAIVGARNASGNGRRLAHMFGRELAAHDLVIVSGLARGIDSAAHQGALDAGGITVAVIASGVDVPYPSENTDLAGAIARTGAVISERPMGAAPQARHFPRRNRIISGMALGVVVVEAAPKSGSLITARLALEQDREVMAVPGSPLDARHRGTNRLLKDGAHLVETAEDVMAVIKPLIDRAPRKKAPVDPRPRPAAPARQAIVRTSETAAKSAPLLSDRLLALLGAEALPVDELIRQCQAGAAEIQETLVELELVGAIERQPGNRVARGAR